MSDIEVEIDGLPATVDSDEWQSNRAGIEADIRTAREAVSDLSGLFEPDPDLDYDTLVAAFGEDDETEVPDEG